VCPSGKPRKLKKRPELEWWVESWKADLYKDGSGGWELVDIEPTKSGAFNLAKEVAREMKCRTRVLEVAGFQLQVFDP